MLSSFSRCKIIPHNTISQEVTFLAGSNLFLAFAENQRLNHVLKNVIFLYDRLYDEFYY